jgi:hypothetical protein
VLATIAIFAMGVAAALTLQTGRNVWASITWAAVCSPIFVAIAICILAPVERMAVTLGLSSARRLPPLRPTVVLWFVCAIALPWVIAWLSANVVGNWYEFGRQVQDSASTWLWAVRLATGVVTYSVASAAGLVLVFLFTQEPDGSANQDG